MESQSQEVMGHVVLKGKRTKRHRLLSISISSSPPPPTSSSSSTSSAADASTEEEEDMAHCLILLAQGPQRQTEPTNTNNNKNNSLGLYVYECKTCNKCFPSFQALGGHRASHKKSRPAPPPDDKKAVAFAAVAEDDTSLSLSAVVKSSRVHGCSVCGAEFSSGQALGGHMRRHRQNAVAAAAASPEHSKKVMLLDLNLPAPGDDDREFAKPFVFSASALVDCHY
ncbi:Zinc finger protein ZAT5 [Acorus calamus]|uniref:Zinc finger protein ZAT5 n=1 Tax=Acorus calamus TaxID=4465 RepID=A0AAV9C7L6_ACOCL|nr:Zinc finger protein ZAT5 [Acorus calamus]